MFVANWMSRNPIAVEPTATVPEVLDLMRRHRIRSVPVVARDNLVGIVSLSDVREYLPSKATELEAHELRYLIDKTSVSQVMTANPRTVDPETPIEHAAVLLRRYKIGSLPVLEAGRLVGILTQSDVFEAMVELLGEHEPGARITLDIGASATALQHVFHLLEEFAPNLVSAVTYSREDFPSSRGLVLKLRLGQPEAQKLLFRLEQDGISVVDARIGNKQIAAEPRMFAAAFTESHQVLGNLAY